MRQETVSIWCFRYLTSREPTYPTDQTVKGQYLHTFKIHKLESRDKTMKLYTFIWGVPIFFGWVAWNPWNPPTPPSCPTRRHHKFHRSSWLRENCGDGVATVRIPKKAPLMCILLMDEIRRSPVDMVKIPLFTGSYTSQVVVWDFFHQQYERMKGSDPFFGEENFIIGTCSYLLFYFSYL